MTLRPTRDEKFSVRDDGERYTVQGKGGLVREVSVPHALAQRLEAARLSRSQRVTDWGVHYQHHIINGDQRWSSSWNQASNAAMRWSIGAHGLRPGAHG